MKHPSVKQKKKDPVFKTTKILQWSLKENLQTFLRVGFIRLKYTSQIKKSFVFRNWIQTKSFRNNISVRVLSIHTCILKVRCSFLQSLRGWQLYTERWQPSATHTK